MTWEIHVSCVKEIRNLYKLFVGKFDEEQRLLWKPEFVRKEPGVVATAGRFQRPDLVGPSLVITGALRRWCPKQSGRVFDSR